VTGQHRSERLSFLRPAAVPGAEFLIAYDSFRPWHVFHERYEVCACRTAAAGWRYRGKSQFLNDGSLMLMEPGEVHRTTVVHKYSDFKVLFIDAELFKIAAKEVGLVGTPHLRLSQSEDPRLFRATYRFCASAVARDTPLAQQSWFASCVRLLLGCVEQTPRLETANAQTALERAKRYLRERFNEPVHLDELSTATGLSRFHLAHTFARHVGMPPHTYQIHVRIERASELLRAGIPPADAAARVGFADQSHFTRHFKRIWRTTPARYAQAA